MTFIFYIFSYTAVNFKQRAMAQSRYHEWPPSSWLAWGSATPITVTYLFPHVYPEGCSCRQQQSYYLLLPLHKPLWVIIHQGSIYSYIIYLWYLYVTFNVCLNIVVFTQISYSRMKVKKIYRLKSIWIPHLGKDMSYEESSWIRFMIYNFLILFLFIFYKFCNFIFEVYIVSPLCLSGTAKR